MMVLDHSTWPADIEEYISNDRHKEAIIRLATEFNMGQNADTIYLSWKGAMRALSQRPDYMNGVRRTTPAAFWQDMIALVQWNDTFKRFILAALSIPYRQSSINLSLTHYRGMKQPSSYPQNGICNQKYHFWPKNYDENLSRKIYFEIPPCKKMFGPFYEVRECTLTPKIESHLKS